MRVRRNMFYRVSCRRLPRRFAPRNDVIGKPSSPKQHPATQTAFRLCEQSEAISPFFYLFSLCFPLFSCVPSGSPILLFNFSRALARLVFRLKGQALPLGNFPRHPIRHILAFKAHSLAAIGKFFFPSDIEILAFIAVDFIGSLRLHDFRLPLAKPVPLQPSQQA